MKGLATSADHATENFEVTTASVTNTNSSTPTRKSSAGSGFFRRLLSKEKKAPNSSNSPANSKANSNERSGNFGKSSSSKEKQSSKNKNGNNNGGGALVVEGDFNFSDQEDFSEEEDDEEDISYVDYDVAVVARASPIRTVSGPGNQGGDSISSSANLSQSQQKRNSLRSNNSASRNGNAIAAQLRRSNYNGLTVSTGNSNNNINLLQTDRSNCSSTPGSPKSTGSAKSGRSWRSNNNSPKAGAQGTNSQSLLSRLLDSRRSSNKSSRAESKKKDSADGNAALNDDTITAADLKPESKTDLKTEDFPQQDPPVNFDKLTCRDACSPDHFLPQVDSFPLPQPQPLSSSISFENIHSLTASSRSSGSAASAAISSVGQSVDQSQHISRRSQTLTPQRASKFSPHSLKEKARKVATKSGLLNRNASNLVRRFSRRSSADSVEPNSASCEDIKNSAAALRKSINQNSENKSSATSRSITSATTVTSRSISSKDGNCPSVAGTSGNNPSIGLELLSATALDLVLNTSDKANSQQAQKIALVKLQQQEVLRTEVFAQRRHSLKLDFSGDLKRISLRMESIGRGEGEFTPADNLVGNTSPSAAAVGSGEVASAVMGEAAGEGGIMDTSVNGTPVGTPGSPVENDDAGFVKQLSTGSGKKVRLLEEGDGEKGEGIGANLSLTSLEDLPQATTSIILQKSDFPSDADVVTAPVIRNINPADSQAKLPLKEVLELTEIELEDEPVPHTLHTIAVQLMQEGSTPGSAPLRGPIQTSLFRMLFLTTIQLMYVEGLYLTSYLSSTPQVVLILFLQFFGILVIMELVRNCPKKWLPAKMRPGGSWTAAARAGKAGTNERDEYDNGFGSSQGDNAESADNNNTNVDVTKQTTVTSVLAAAAGGGSGAGAKSANSATTNAPATLLTAIGDAVDNTEKINKSAQNSPTSSPPNSPHAPGSPIGSPKGLSPKTSPKTSPKASKTKFRSKSPSIGSRGSKGSRSKSPSGKVDTSPKLSPRGVPYPRVEHKSKKQSNDIDSNGKDNNSDGEEITESDIERDPTLDPNSPKLLPFGSQKSIHLPANKILVPVMKWVFIIFLIYTLCLALYPLANVDVNAGMWFLYYGLGCLLMGLTFNFTLYYSYS